MLRVGQLVLVKFTGKRKGQSKKLLARQQGPWRVVEVHDGVSATLELVANPDDRIRRHASAIVPYEVDEDMAEDHFEVESIRSERKVGRVTEYLVRFASYGSDFDKWIPEADLNAPEILKEWKRRVDEREIEPKCRVVRVVDKDIRRGEPWWLCATVEDAGPESYEWLTRDRVLNPALLDRFDSAPRLSAGGGVGRPKASAARPSRSAAKGRASSEPKPVRAKRQEKVPSAPRSTGKSQGRGRRQGAPRRTETAAADEPGRHMTRGAAKAKGLQLPDLSYRF